MPKIKKSLKRKMCGKGIEYYIAKAKETDRLLNIVKNINAVVEKDRDVVLSRYNALHSKVQRLFGLESPFFTPETIRLENVLDREGALNIYQAARLLRDHRAIAQNSYTLHNTPAWGAPINAECEILHFDSFLWELEKRCSGYGSSQHFTFHAQVNGNIQHVGYAMSRNFLNNSPADLTAEIISECVCPFIKNTIAAAQAKE